MPMVIVIAAFLSLHDAYMIMGSIGLLAETIWPVCKTYAYWLFRNSLENFLLINVQTIAIQPEYSKIL